MVDSSLNRMVAFSANFGPMCAILPLNAAGCESFCSDDIGENFYPFSGLKIKAGICDLLSLPGAHPIEYSRPEGREIKVSR
jgi:hypothetical protein